MKAASAENPRRPGESGKTAADAAVKNKRCRERERDRQREREKERERESGESGGERERERQFPCKVLGNLAKAAKVCYCGKCGKPNKYPPILARSYMF